MLSLMKDLALCPEATMDTPQASTSAIPYDAVNTPAMEDESDATSEEEESEIEAAVISRGRRSNAGSRYASLPMHWITLNVVQDARLTRARRNCRS